MSSNVSDYCDHVSGLPTKCLTHSILEIWNFDRDKIASLSNQQIVDDVNTVDFSRTFGVRKNFTGMLGAKRYNSTGHVIAAKSTHVMWMMNVDEERKVKHKTGVDLLAVRADRVILHWENEFIAKMRDKAREVRKIKGYKLRLKAERSLNTENEVAIEKDSQKVIVCYSVMFLYVIIMLGRFNRVEQRFFLATAGICAVLLGTISGMALVVGAGFVYTPLHMVLPYLCMGIGIDDMFVIVQCWDNLPIEPWTAFDDTLADRMGRTLKHAGVAITITTLTDVFAFGIGIFSVMKRSL